MSVSPDDFAVCLACGVTLQAEGEAIQDKGYHYGRKSRKERVPVAWRHGRRVRSVPEEAVTAAVRGVHGGTVNLPHGDGSMRPR